MEQNGWIFENLVSKPNKYQRQCNNDTWYGWRKDYKIPGIVSATFRGSGTATLTFGNCYNLNTVDVYFNNEKIATANGDERKKKATFNFYKGSVLRIEVVRPILKLNALEISCDEGKFQYFAITNNLSTG